MPATFPAILELVVQPFGRGNLVSDDNQWSSEKDTTTTFTQVAVESVVIDAQPRGKLVEMEFCLVCAIKAVSSATADIGIVWYAKDKDKTNWVVLYEEEVADLGTTYIEKTAIGFFPVELGQLEKLPVEVKLAVACNELNEGRAKIKASSFVRLVWSVEG